jgi:hypothetical protein
MRNSSGVEGLPGDMTEEVLAAAIGLCILELMVGIAWTQVAAEQ